MDGLADELLLVIAQKVSRAWLLVALIAALMQCKASTP